MKYVPGLIPEKLRVDVNSIVSDDVPEKIEEQRKDLTSVYKFLGILLYVISVLTIFRRFWEGLLFVFLATVIFPDGKDFLEKTLRFNITNRIRVKVIAINIVLIIFSILHYDKVDEGIAREKKIEAEKRIELEKTRKEKLESDKLNADNMFKIGNLEKGLTFLNSAIDSSVEEKNDLIHKRANVNFNFRKFENALEDYNYLLGQNYNTGTTHYERAVCFIRLNKTKEAIDDIKKSIQLGNKDAEKLHESINPLRRRIVYYVTRCCNGSTSSATGRGACSRNGGVCNWQEPIYEEYREY